MTPPTESDLLFQTIHIARELEKGGLYNAAKLFWAAAFAHEIRVTNALPAGSLDGLPGEMEAVIAALEASGSDPAVTAAMRASISGVRENRTITYAEVPAVAVCRACGAIQLGEAVACPACGADALTLRQVAPIWFFDPLTPAQVLAALEAGPDVLRGFAAGLTDAQLNHPPAPGEWSMRETLWHVLVAEQLFAGRVQKLLAEDNPSLSGLASWAVTGEDALSAQAILQEYDRLRQDTLARLREMPAEGWWRTGFHEEWGQVTVLQQAVYFARHERAHFAQIAAARQAAAGQAG